MSIIGKKILLFAVGAAFISNISIVKADTAAPSAEKTSPSSQSVSVPTTLRDASTAEVIARFSQIGGDNSLHLVANVSVLVKAPDKVRVEPVSEETDGSAHSLGAYISDGKTQWEYKRAVNEYQVVSPPNGIGVNRLVIFDAWVPMQIFPVDRYKAFSSGMKQLSSTVELLDGKSVIKVVAEGPGMQHVTWYDKSSGLPVRFSVFNTNQKPSIEMVRVDFGKWTINQPVDDNMFTWKPPFDASKVKKPTVIRLGQPAPDIEGVGIDGKTVRLSDCKGKPTLITFWSSWSDQSEEAINFAKSAQDKDGKDKLNVMPVCVWDSKSDFEIWYLHHYETYPFPLLFDSTGQAPGNSIALFDYDLPGLPDWVLVDKEGKIAALEEDTDSASKDRIDAALTKLLSPEAPKKS
jgi:outer membrane lipoprotein-sorting protein/peroxiredoxin